MTMLRSQTLVYGHNGAAGGRSFADIFKDAWRGEVKPTQAEDLAELVAKHDMKVGYSRNI